MRNCALIGTLLHPAHPKRLSALPRYTAAGDQSGASAPGDRKARPLTIVGIDDYAWEKGQRYNTVVVDLEAHRPMDVLADRAAETVATGSVPIGPIQVISRDRGGAYARVAFEGVPQAQQVADRFHLLKNWHQHSSAHRSLGSQSCPLPRSASRRP